MVVVVVGGGGVLVAVVLTINHADERLEVVHYTTPSAPCDKSKLLCSEGSKVAGKHTRSKHSKDLKIDNHVLILWW